MRDLAIFSLGRLPEEGGARRKAEDLAARLHAHLGGGRMTYGEAGHALGLHPNQLRYAAPTGTPDPLGRRTLADRLDRTAT